MRNSTPCQMLSRMHMGERCQVLVGLGTSVLGCIAFTADRAPDEELANPVASTMSRQSHRIGIDADFNSIDDQWQGVGRSRFETKVLEIERVCRSLKGLNGFD